MKVLVIDDEEKIRRIYRELLTQEGYEALEAENGDIANLLLSTRGIDLVLLDINMPVVDGTALYDLLRLYNPKIRVIVTSIYPLEDQKKLVYRADEYYDKSQGTEVLMTRVRELTQSKAV